MRELPHTHSCFVCGESNAAGLKLRFETDGKIVQSRFAPCAHHVGFKDTVHGGLITTVLDEIMVWACAVTTRKFAWAAELNVRFVAPLHPGEKAVAIGELVANRREKIYEAKGELRNAAGLVVASATGKYLPIKDADIKDLLADLVGDTSALFAPAA
jgi:acyl-coenzyme A thioesterase PaaI-like protein